MLWHYFRCRHRRFADRQALEHHQRRQLRRFSRRTLRLSPWFARFADRPMDEWPLMDKATMMAHFDEMNTAGLQRDALFRHALDSEHSRDFRTTVGSYSVGLSSGTSGQRGLFVVGRRDMQRWAGVVLAKVLPDGLRAGERVALFLRADNALYQSVNNRWLTLRYFDLLQPFATHWTALQHYAPSLIVAPAQVLRALALAVERGDLRLRVKKVISVAEVLEPQDRLLLARVFPAVGEIYQATEGFLAATCAHGTLHLNEAHLHIEPLWLDSRRFVPVITDFSRHTQPIVRYRLDDVLVVRDRPCPCGNPERAISRIEGRQDDQLLLRDAHGRLCPVFADVLARVLATHLPLTADYRLRQTDATTLELESDAAPAALEDARQALQQTLDKLGMATAGLIWHLVSTPLCARFDHKRRRIIRMWQPADQQPEPGERGHE